MQHSHLIIADDFTGALDTGVQFLQADLSTTFVLQESYEIADAHVFSSESRNVDEVTAAARSRAIAARHSEAMPYKKIDSTMRGHVGAEIEAVLAARGIAKAVICPAAPDAGRTVEHGQLLVDGIPLHQTAFARDPHWPAHTSVLTELLRRPCTHLEHATAEAITGAPTALVSVNARTNANLAAIAHAAHHAGAMPCGSLGLARVWAQMFERTPAQRPALPHIEYPALVVAGSRHPITNAQLAHLIAAGAASFTPHDEIAAMRSALIAGRTVILRTVDDFIDGGMTHDLAEAAERLLRIIQPGALILTGGETAFAVCAKLDVTAVHIKGELAVGVPWGTIFGGVADGVTIVTKAGGFGDEHALIRALERLHDTPP